MNHAAITHFIGFLRHKVPDVLWDFAHIRYDNASGVALLSRFTRVAEDDPVVQSLLRLEPDCGAAGCAVGLAAAVFPGVSTFNDLAEVLGIPHLDASYLFGFDTGKDQLGWLYGDKTHEAVTRHDVADALERYQREGAWWREEA